MPGYLNFFSDIVKRASFFPLMSWDGYLEYMYAGKSVCLPF